MVGMIEWSESILCSDEEGRNKTEGGGREKEEEETEGHILFLRNS